MDLMTGLAREQGATVVIVTHDARIAAYASRVAMVRDGLVSAIDQPAMTASSSTGSPTGARGAH
jgi:putative ABC transport system ATP-binding protein